MCHAVVAETGMPSEAARGVTTDRMLAPAVAEVPPVWDLEVEVEASVAEAEVPVVVAVGGADEQRE